jgi:hypothetical protein
MDGRDLLVMAVVVGARLIVPLFIPKYPLPAGILALTIDGIDQSIFQIFTTMILGWYQSYDKALDVYYLSIEYLSTMRNWINLYAFRMSRFLYYYRLVGTLLFELLQMRALLLIFPNTFEYFFLFYEGVRLRWNPKRLSLAAVIGAAFAVWVFIKVPQEFWIHIAQLDFTDAVKEHVFGVPIDTSWGTIVSQHVPFFIALVVALLILGGIARWFIVTKLPPADWSFSFNADAHGFDVSQAELAAARRVSAQRLFSAELFEKIALVSLVTIIFSRILPSVNVGVLHVTVGVATIIVANTVVSEWLVRRGVSWRSTIVEFFVMALVNAGLVVLANAVLPWINASIDSPATLFGVLLLTLLVTLYDRFRPYERVRAETEDAVPEAAR